MDKVFKALADSTRRKLLDRLKADNGQTLSALCVRANMTRQAVTKHLGLLEDANLVVVVWRGRTKLHYLNPVPIHEVYERWIGKYEQHRVRALFDLVVILMQPVTGDGLRDDSPPRQRDIVGALEEVLAGVRIRKQVGAVLRQFRAEVGAFVAGEPQRVAGDGGIGPADHFEFEACHNGSQRHGRVGEEAGVAQAAKLFRAEQREHRSEERRVEKEGE